MGEAAASPQSFRTCKLQSNIVEELARTKQGPLLPKEESQMGIRREPGKLIRASKESCRPYIQWVEFCR